MMRATELSGRAVIDIDAAEKLGTVDKLILDPDGRRVAGFVVAKGSGIAGNKNQTIIPATAIHAIGPDAVTVRQTAVVGSDIGRLESLPRGSDLIGRKVVSEDGRFLGKVNDVLIDRESGRIIGYLLSEHKPGKKFEQLFGSDRKKRDDQPYLPADANLRSGRDLIVASEDALNYEWTEEAATKAENPPSTRWSDPLPPASGTNNWVGSSAPVVDDVDVVGTPRSRERETDVDGRETNPHVR